MSKIFNVNSFSQRKKFEIRLQVALLKNTLKIKENSKNPEKYDEYLAERIQKIRELLGTTSKFTIMDGDNVLFTLEENVKNIK